jgi:hypothetical protein
MTKKDSVKSIIHVNQHVVKANRKHKKNDPVLTLKTYKSQTNAHEAYIDGPCRIVYRPDRPLSCGAHVWIETQASVIVEK